MNQNELALHNLKLCTGLPTFSNLIGLEPKSLGFILYGMSEDAKYNLIKVPKKTDGYREVFAPIKPLKQAQRNTAKLLVECEEVISKSLIKWDQKSVSHGYKKGYSIYTNARNHKGKRYVFNVDIKDFFGSIHFGRIYGILLKHKSYSLNPAVAKLIAHMACKDGVLCQGSPLSPVLSNIVGSILDSRLLKLAKSRGLTYSRYVDDITFSTNKKQFPNSVGLEAFDQSKGVLDWVAGSELVREVERSGFKLNTCKTRMHISGSRQQATGLIVNEIVNVDSGYQKIVRAKVHIFAKSGNWHGVEGVTAANRKILRGQLDYLYWVKKQNGYFGDGRNKDGYFSVPSKSNPLSGFRETFYKFLFAENFIHNRECKVLYEGVTDGIYLKAIKQNFRSKGYTLPKFSPVSMSKTFNEVLGNSGGSSYFAQLISNYERLQKRYSNALLSNPVIILLDNDKGLKPLKDVKCKIADEKIVSDKSKSFYHVCSNLYIILTPLVSDSDTCMEDFFKDDALKFKVRGKSFSPALAKHENTKNYSKAVFAREVVAPGALSLDLSNFKPIVDRIKLVSRYHQKTTYII